LSLCLPCRGMIKLLRSRMRVQKLKQHKNGNTTYIYSMKTSSHMAFGQLNKTNCPIVSRRFIRMRQITHPMNPSAFRCLSLLSKLCLEYSTTSCTPSTLLSSMVSSRSLGQHLYHRLAKFLFKNAETPPIFSCCVRRSICIG